MHLLEGKLPIGDEDDLGIVTRPYPGWENKAKETLDRIPTAETKSGAATTARQSAAAATSVSVGMETPHASNENTTVTHEEPADGSPAAPSPTSPAVSAPAATVPPKAGAEGVAKAVIPPAAAPAPTPTNPPTAAAKPSPAPALVLPAQKQPLVVTAAEDQKPGVSPTAGDQPPVASGAAKQPEPTPAERLAALMKQRSEFLAALKAEVSRRQSATDDDDELARLEQELRLVQLAGEQPEEAVREIESLDGAEREAFAHLLMGLATWMNADEAHRPTLRNAKIVREIRDAAAELAAASKLDVRNLAFCEKVESYGWYTEFPRRQFKSKQQVILYAEVENFAAVRTSAESFETELQGSYQIFDSRGNLVDERELPLDKEVCRNYRRDYFLAYLIYLPEGLSPGGYRLELTVEDKKGSAVRPETPAGYAKVEDKHSKTTSPSSAAFRGRKLGTGTIEFTIK